MEENDESGDRIVESLVKLSIVERLKSTKSSHDWKVIAEMANEMSTILAEKESELEEKCRFS